MSKNIITQNNITVNPDTGELITVNVTTTVIINNLTTYDENVNKFDKWTAKKIKTKSMSKRMYAIGMKERGKRMSDCSNHINYTYCPDCAAYKVSNAHLCRDRLCPICRWKLSLKRYSIMAKAMDEHVLTHPKSTYYLATLTVRNCPMPQLRDTMQKMSHAWSLMRRRSWFVKAIKGWGRSVEVTYNAEARTAHPHHHILLAVDEENELNNQRTLLQTITETWRNSLNLDYAPIVDCREIYDRSGLEGNDITPALLETYKYAVKDTTLDNMPLSDFKTFATQFSHHRLTAFGGTIKASIESTSPKADMDTAGDEEIIIATCEHCGGSMQRAVAQWSGTRYMDIYTD